MRNLLKAMLTTGGATVLGQVLGLIVNKVLAHFVGTAGVGFFSLCRQVHDSAAGIGSIGFGGLLQGLAARQGEERRRLLRAALLLAAIGAALVTVILLLQPELVANWLFGRDDELTLTAVRLCAVTATMAIAYGILSGMINAARAIVVLAGIGIAGGLVAAAIAWPIAVGAQDHPWVLVGLIGFPTLAQLMLALLALPRLGYRWTALGTADSRPGAGEFRYFAGFLAFNVALTGVGIAASLYVRARVVQSGGLAAAGLFAAAWGIGMQSISVVLSSFGTYVLPTLAGADNAERTRVLRDMATLMLGISLPLLTALLMFKPVVLRILFTAEFLPAVALLQWLLIGNFIKAISWVVAVPFLASADLRRYFVIEAGWHLLFAGGVALGTQQMDWLPAVGVSFVAAYSVYFLAAAWFAARRFGFRLSRRSSTVFVLGCAVLVLAAWSSWDETFVRWPLAVAISLAACLVSLLGLTPQQRQRGRQLVLRAVGR